MAFRAQAPLRTALDPFILADDPVANVKRGRVDAHALDRARGGAHAVA